MYRSMCSQRHLISFSIFRFLLSRSPLPLFHHLYGGSPSVWILVYRSLLYVLRVCWRNCIAFRLRTIRNVAVNRRPAENCNAQSAAAIKIIKLHEIRPAGAEIYWNTNWKLVFSLLDLIFAFSNTCRQRTRYAIVPVIRYDVTNYNVV